MLVQKVLSYKTFAALGTIELLKALIAGFIYCHQSRSITFHLFSVDEMLSLAPLRVLALGLGRLALYLQHGHLVLLLLLGRGQGRLGDEVEDGGLGAGLPRAAPLDGQPDAGLGDDDARLPRLLRVGVRHHQLQVLQVLQLEHGLVAAASLARHGLHLGLVYLDQNLGLGLGSLRSHRPGLRPSLVQSDDPHHGPD